MTPERRRLVEKICDAALDRPFAERAAYVAESCGGDEVLRAEVESLLRHAPHAEASWSAPLGRLAVAAFAPPAPGLRLSPGMRLGPYVVVAPLGAGGMGEVYRGRDERLGRDVALKVLPVSFAADVDRAARFEREARALAALNHPNIAQIHGVEEASGVRALALELVEGTTVARLIASGPLTVSDALGIARQLSGALRAAHDRGIVHRDLKPANVMVTPDGRAKVLDFGLAARFEDRPGASGQKPTVDGLTRTGDILGTTSYMSPEQATGRPVDKRTDIWAFGCVLYEMLTGVRAFEGDSAAASLVAVLQHDPDWSKLPAAMPPPLRRLLAICLAKDLQTRLADISTAQYVLDSIAVGEVANDTTVTDTAAGRVRVSTRWAWVAVVGAAAVAVLVLAAGWLVRGQNPAVPSAVRQVTVQLPVDLSWTTVNGTSNLSIAPDGSALAFVARRNEVNQLFVHHLTNATTTVVNRPPGAGQPVFSPDGRALAFITADGIWRAPAVGGEGERLCSATGIEKFQGFRGGSWGQDGRIVFGSAAGLLQVGRPGSQCEVIVPVASEREARFLWPQVLPAGRGILATVSDVSDDVDSASIVAVRPGDSTRTVVVRGGRGGRLTTSGHLVFARGDALFAAPFDLDELRLTAEPVRVLEDVATGLFGGPMAAVSDLGDLVYGPGASPMKHLVWVTRDGRRSTANTPPGRYQPDVRLSPDGRRVALVAGEGDHFAWVYTFETGTLAPLFTRGDVHGLVWSPDSQRVAFPWYGRGVAVARLDDAADPELVTPARYGMTPWAWSPDGRELLYSQTAPSGGFELLALRVGDRSTRKLLNSTLNNFQPQFSPDGQSLAYVAGPANRPDLFVTDYPALRLKVPVSTDGGTSPAWSPDGTELFYLRGATMMAATRRPGDGRAFSRPVELFGNVESFGSLAFSVAADGRFLLVDNAGPPNAPRNQLALVLNWLEQLRRQVPIP